MKIIDLLNKIANCEEVPKKIKINEIIFEYQGDDYLYKNEDKEYWLFSDGYTDKFEWLYSALNTEVEIIEEKEIPKKLQGSCDMTTSEICRMNNIEVKINEIIDYLKSKGE